MARPLRIEFSGAVYHITSRGNSKEPIFLDSGDKKLFLEIFSSVVARFNWVCHGYCLMENHYHLLIETPEGNLSRGMRQLNGVYTQDFNRRHKKVGHLFQGRYKAILVEKETHLLELCRYVVLNPIRAGLVKSPTEWRWSNYRATAGQMKRPVFLEVDWVLSQFGRQPDKAKEAYRKFVGEGCMAKSPWDSVRGQILLGTDEFRARLRYPLRGKGEVKEVPRVQRYVARPSLLEILERIGEISRKEIDQLVYRAYVEYGYKMGEIADFLGAHYTTVSRAIGRVETIRNRRS